MQAKHVEGKLDNLEPRNADLRVAAQSGLCDGWQMEHAPEPANEGVPLRPAPSRVTRWAWFGVGWLFVGLGIVGAFLPLMPTTIFIILAAGCFARSSPRLETWLLDHRHFGPGLRAWRAEGAIPRRGKVAACIGIAIGYTLFWWNVRPGLFVDVAVALALAACAAFILTRPAPARERGEL
jgi:uncharacterized membrane protein YbaN (DUF454 family)